MEKLGNFPIVPSKDEKRNVKIYLLKYKTKEIIPFIKVLFSFIVKITFSLMT